MSYEVTVRESTIKIKKELVKQALEDICNHQKQHGTFQYCYFFNIEDINFNNYGIDDNTWSAIDIFHDCLGLVCKYEDDCLFIKRLRYDGLAEELDIFNVIAPYCYDGGYMEFCGEDGELFRYTIKDESCIEQSPKIVWE
jgi:hypothetical protein|nr:MAG TPA: hypothetical protein [Caudoviricetes sp.]